MRGWSPRSKMGRSPDCCSGAALRRWRSTHQEDEMTAIALETPSRALPRETSSSRADAMPAIALIAHRLSPTNAQLLQAFLALGVSAFLARPKRAGSLPI